VPAFWVEVCDSGQSFLSAAIEAPTGARAVAWFLSEYLAHGILSDGSGGTTLDHVCCRVRRTRKPVQLILR
jgi:hypothetical protein